MGNDASSNSKKSKSGGGPGLSSHSVKRKAKKTEAAAPPLTTSEPHAEVRKDTVPLEKDEKDTVSKAHHQSNKVPNSNETEEPKAEKDSIPPFPPPKMKPSVATFATGGNGSPEKARSRFQTSDGVMITDALTDVRVKYHINPREIGHGHYGVVRKCMDRYTREWYAIKSIRKSKVGKIDVLKREIEILKEVNHPNIIRLIEVHEDTKYLHLVTELCTGGELFDRIIAKTQSDEGHFSERDAAKLVLSILDAIAYCHDVKQIVHRDLKPENFLFKTEADDAPVKIIDFGLSRHDTQNLGVMKTKVGTPYYVAPEVLNREYTKSCDIWSIGVITYILLCGYPPFYGDNDNQIFDSVRTGRFDFPSPDWDSISNEAKDFVCALLRKDSSKRLSAADAMRHQWIKDKTGKLNGESARVGHRSTRSFTFKKFMGMQKLKKAAMGYIASHLTQSEVGNLGEIFKSIDKDGDGVMSLKELDNSVAHGGFPSDLQLELKQLREDLSLSGEDMIDWKEFLAAMMDKSLLMREDKIRMAFDHFKKSDGTFLLVSDLVEMFGGESQAREIMGDIDSDGDGRITYEDFRSMMAQSFGGC